MPVTGPVPNQYALNTALRSFLLSILPAAVEVIRGQVNKTPEPSSLDFVVFWPLLRERIETNTDTSADVRFLGSINGTTLTVSSVSFGTIGTASPVTLFGTGVMSGTNIIKQLSGSVGAVGTYQLSQSQTVTLGVMAAGVEAILQPTKVLIQCDVHGPNSGDNAQIISTLFRDDYAVEAFEGLNLGDITPLYADDPKQVPFLNAEQQYEDRWVVEAFLQVNAVVTVPQQFADEVDVGLVDVDVVYPP